MLVYKNEDARLKAEMVELRSKNLPLFTLMADLATWVQTNLKKDIMITMISRTQAEQDYIYRNDPKYKAKKFKSPHQLWHSVDLRSRNFTTEEITKIENYLNEKYKVTNYYGWTAKNHKVTDGVDHFHLQFIRK